MSLFWFIVKGVFFVWLAVGIVLGLVWLGSFYPNLAAITVFGSFFTFFGVALGMDAHRRNTK